VLRTRPDQALTARFDALDVDADGHIDERDYAAMARRLIDAFGFDPHSVVAGRVRDRYRQFWHALRRTTDVDGDSRVSKREFVAAVIGGHAGRDHTLLRAAAPIAAAVVELADFDADGRLDEAEFRKLFSALGVTDADCGEAFIRTDRDGDGYLTRRELLLALEEFYCSAEPEAGGSWRFGRI
jgi:Ca2+-binding EF-hand superfamily protein